MALPRAFVILASLWACAPVGADFPDVVSSWSSAFGGLADPNTGLTMFPILAMPMGGRAEGMAGAYAAMGGGAEGLEANPAASVFMRGGQLLFSHRNGIGDSSIEGVAGAGSFGPIGLGAFSKVFLSPFTKYDGAGRQAGKGYFIEAVASANCAFMILALGDGAGVSAGVNMMGVMRSVPDALAAGQSAFGFAVDVGALGRFRLPAFSGSSLPNFGVGVVARNVGLSSLLMGNPLPSELCIAVAYAPLSVLTATVDVTVPVSFDGQSYPAEMAGVAVGLEVRLTGFASVHGGVRLKGDNPRFVLGSRVGAGPVSFVVNDTVDLMGGVNPLGNFSVTAVVPLGGQGGR